MRDASRAWCVVSEGGVPEPLTPLTEHPAHDLAELGTRVRAEWQADETEWMREAARRWAHGRRIADVLVEYAARGDRVAIEVGGCVFEGVVTAVGDDRVDLQSAVTQVTVRTAQGAARGATAMPIVVKRSARARCGGRRIPPALVTFVARLRELEVEGCAVRLGVLMSPGEVTGTVVVGADHVVVRADDEVVVPLAWVAYVVASSGAS